MFEKTVLMWCGILQVSKDIYVRVFEQYSQIDKWHLSTSAGHFTWEGKYTGRASWMGTKANFSCGKTPTLDGEVSLHVMTSSCCKNWWMVYIHLLLITWCWVGCFSVILLNSPLLCWVASLYYLSAQCLPPALSAISKKGGNRCLDHLL